MGGYFKSCYCKVSLELSGRKIFNSIVEKWLVWTTTSNSDVLLTVHLSIFILVINQLDAQNLFYSKFISCLYMFRAPRAHRQAVKILLYSLWYHQTYRWPSPARHGHLYQRLYNTILTS